MSKTKFTPGSWFINHGWFVGERPGPMELLAIQSDATLDGDEPSDVAYIPKSTDSEESATAALISAAPDCFDALAPIETEIENRKDGDIFHSSWNPDAHVELTLTIAECRAVVLALKKARGECTNA